MQGAVLCACGKEAGAFDTLARSVRSGDPDNVEAQAARRYWPLLMGKEFRRDPAAEGANGLLNYGYTVVRAILSRAICASGLHPTLGVHHSNQFNAFALADDLMEPYRPIVDMAVFNLVATGEVTVTPITKAVLASLGSLDLETPEGVSPLSTHAVRLTHSVATSFERGKCELSLPVPPSPLALSGIGKTEIA